MNENKISVVDISDSEVKEIITNANKQRTKVSEASEIFDYSKELSKISIPSSQNKVIYTDGMIQLKYENGEFFKVDTKDATSNKVKLTRKEATDMYVEFFIKSRLNPLIARKQELRSIGMDFNKKDIEKTNDHNIKMKKPRRLEDNDIMI